MLAQSRPGGGRELLLAQAQEDVRERWRLYEHWRAAARAGDAAARRSSR